MSNKKSGGQILYGGPVTEDYTHGAKSLGEHCLKQLKESGDRVLLINGTTDEELVASRLLAQSVRVAECLLHAGIKTGDVIGVCSENRFEVADVIFGAFYIGATLAPLSATYSEGELNHSISLTKPKIIFVSPAVCETVVKVTKQKSFVKKVYVFGDEFIGKTYSSFNRFVRNSNVKSTASFSCPPQNMKELNAILFCSSGTTGLPKGVQLTQDNVLYSMRSSVTTEDIDANVYLSISPWTHIFGSSALLRTATNRLRSIVMTRFDEKAYLNCIQKYKVTTIVVVPPLMVFLAKSPLVDQYDISSVHTAISSAAPLSRETELAVCKRTNITSIRQVYGSSEVQGVLMQSDTNHKPGSVGTLQPGVWAKVVDTETGDLLGPHQSGELLFKSNGSMKGYIGNDEANRVTFDADGFIHTGDIGYYDDDKEFFIVDRLKELIKYNGYQVPPAELEAILLTHPKVRDAGVVGLEEESVGELPLAFVVKDGVVTEKELQDFVASKVSSPKRLRGGVRFIAVIPKNPTGKILRRELRDLLKGQKSKL